MDTPPTAEKLPPATETPSTPSPWIGVDLDGTLATHGLFSGLEKVGKPVKEMVKRVKFWLANGYEVRILTARAELPEAIPIVAKWLKKHHLGELKITNEIDRHCIEIWDDRGVNVVRNTGMAKIGLSVYSRPKAPLLEEAFPHENRRKLDLPQEAPAPRLRSRAHSAEIKTPTA